MASEERGNQSSKSVVPHLGKTQQQFRGGKSDIKISHDKDELLANMRDGVDYILQEYIEKDYEINLLGLSLGKEGKVLSPGIIKKLREYPIGSSSFAKIESFEDYPFLNLNGIEQFIRKIGYEGLFSVEFVVKGDKCYFLEINMRNDGNGYMSTGAGLNLPLVWYHYCCGIVDDSHSLHLTKPFYFMSEETDHKQISEGHLTKAEWLRSLFKSDAFFIINRKDIRPGLAFLALTICRKLTHIAGVQSPNLKDS